MWCFGELLTILPEIVKKPKMAKVPLLTPLFLEGIFGVFSEGFFAHKYVSSLMAEGGALSTEIWDL